MFAELHDGALEFEGAARRATAATGAGGIFVKSYSEMKCVPMQCLVRRISAHRQNLVALLWSQLAATCRHAGAKQLEH